jgi:hypothetical protein
MGVSNQDVSGVWDVDAVGVHGNVVGRNLAKELALRADDNNAVALKWIN